MKFDSRLADPSVLWLTNLSYWLVSAQHERPASLEHPPIFSQPPRFKAEAIKQFTDLHWEPFTSQLSARYCVSSDHLVSSRVDLAECQSLDEKTTISRSVSDATYIPTIDLLGQPSRNAGDANWLSRLTVGRGPEANASFQIKED
jgi:hypothetical protein